MEGSSSSETLAQYDPRGTKRNAADYVQDEPSHKKLKGLLVDEDYSEGDRSVATDSGGVSLSPDQTVHDGHGFRVNQAFAQRFEHNKKREELHRCLLRLPYLRGPISNSASGGKIWRIFEI